jgi:serine/threonine protein kinase
VTSERWQQVKELFEAGLECGPGERTTYLAQACAGDEAIRQEVESLLAAHEGDSSFMNTPVGNLLVADQPMLTAGQHFGPYEEISPLGEGGMGQVYLAVDTRLGRKVALKLLPSSYTGDAERVRRFGQEARAASALNHPNIVTIHEIGQTDSLHFIATEFVDGETLRQRLSRQPSNLGEALDIAVQVASALAVAHEAGIIHRDIKPENIMIRPDGYVKILDFGLAKLGDQKNKPIVGLEDETVRQNKTAKGVILGTVNYMSPEQAKGSQVDERTDIFSLGAVVYEMIAGRTPFADDSVLETLANLINSEPLPLSHFTANLPDKLEQVVSKMLRKKAAERYQTMKDLLADFKDLRENLTFEEKLERFASAPKVLARRHHFKQAEYETRDYQTQIPKPVNAYQAYQLSRYHFQQLSPPDLIKSHALLEEALRFDAEFAPAYAALAEQLVMEGITGLHTPAEGFPKAKDALRRVAELNPSSAEFYAAAGLVDLICDWNFPEAERNLRKSLELNSHYAFANNYMGQIFMFQRMPEEAEFYLHRAVEIDPMGLYNLIMLTVGYFLARNYQKVVEECEKMLAVYPRFIIAGWMRCWAFEQTGRAAEALVEYEKIQREPDGGLARRWMGYALALVGDRKNALDTAAKIVAESREHFVSPTHLAALYAGLNETDKACSYLESGLAERDPWMLWIGADPRFDNLRSNSRFEELVKQVIEDERKEAIPTGCKRLSRNRDSEG